MNDQGPREPIGTPWIAAMIFLVVIFLLGVFLYLRLSLPPKQAEQRQEGRRHGFGWVHAAEVGGEFVTRPITFPEEELLINYSTSAAGSVRAEIQDENGNPIDGFSLGDRELMRGDEPDAVVHWRSGSSISSQAGKPVRLRFVMKEADLYSLRTAPSARRP